MPSAYSFLLRMGARCSSAPSMMKIGPKNISVARGREHLQIQGNGTADEGNLGQHIPIIR